jgi:hypothetical protein|tara:strand:- start:1655 stop:1861 length:207 start_codon:yes stop_codon:yes gene_type:complete
VENKWLYNHPHCGTPLGFIIKMSKPRVYNKCTKCKKQLEYELVATQTYKATCCDKEYLIENEFAFTPW